LESYITCFAGVVFTFAVYFNNLMIAVTKTEVKLKEKINLIRNPGSKLVYKSDQIGFSLILLLGRNFLQYPQIKWQ
jgi:hypothetical protein